MSNRRTKDVSYDDYDDYDEEEGEHWISSAETFHANEFVEMSPEDREQLRAGTVKVKAALGSDYQGTDKDIEDALYYYYYDVDKSVEYLKSKNTPKVKKTKSKAPSKFDLAQAAASNGKSLSFPNT